MELATKNLNKGLEEKTKLQEEVTFRCLRNILYVFTF